MEYALLIYSREEDLPDHLSDADRQAFYADFAAFNEALREAKAHVDSRRLKTIETATTVRSRDGSVTTTDGPFSETKECLAGFFVIECADLDEALGWAARIPSARIGSVEVRPIHTYG